MKKNPARRFKKQESGFVLLWVVIGLSFLALAFTLEQSREREKKIDREFELVGQGVARIAGAVNNTLSRDLDAFINAGPAAGAPLTVTFNIGGATKTVNIAHWDAPTVAELSQLQVGLPPNFSAAAPGGGGYKIIISKSPAGCVGSNCNVEGLVALDKPALVSGKVDSARLGIAMRAIGVDGAFSAAATPSTLSGYRGGWNTANPIPGAGIVAARVGYGASAWSPFFRIDGTKQMAADANMGGHSVINAKEVFTTMKAIGDPCTDLGAIAGGIVNGKGAAFVCRDSTWQLAGGKTANANDACSPEGSIATSIANDESLVCKNGKYIRLVNLIARNVEVGRQIVKDGLVVAKPVCDTGGVPDYSFNLNNFTVDVTQSPPKEAMYVTSVDNGASWTIVLRLRDDSSGEVSGNNYSLTAIMHLECKY